MSYGGSNPPLCTTFPSHEPAPRMPSDFSPGSRGRLGIAFAVLLLLALLSSITMEPGQYRSLTWVLLGFFAFRILLGRLRSR